MSKPVEEFIWGDTPAVIFTSLHQLLNCPVYFDGTEPVLEDDKLRKINMPLEHRTPRLKKFQAWEALAGGYWRDRLIVYMLGHMINQDDTKVYIVDGYPARYLSTALEHIKIAYKTITTKEPSTVFTNHFDIVSVDDEQTYKNVISAAEAYANDRGWAYLTLNSMITANTVPELLEHEIAIWELQGGTRETFGQYTGAPAMDALEDDPTEPMNVDEVDAMFANLELEKKDKNGGGEVH